MLTLIEEIAMLNKNTSALSNVLGFGLNAKVSLPNRARFSSSIELLKSWAMVYSIGHFIGTFTSEHALLRSIVQRKEEFIDGLYNELGNEDDEILRDAFKEIVENERIFGLFKIFTTLKIFEHFDRRHIKLAKLNLLEGKYIEQIEDAIIIFSLIWRGYFIIRNLTNCWMISACFTRERYIKAQRICTIITNLPKPSKKRCLILIRIWKN